ncbi:hypothetical protein TEA_020160 [Camellia sinensis var. sinensis]|uniref:Uncharacterized protein n=1 Tax=Camellia sinensis var. sinensis TaxID=542762 RepID=A0A4S4DH65_CAMSN|nr:hypothetical protein TEA_020160 [Camellia sinensis var. sinensis]
MGFDDFEPIFGQAKAEWSTPNSPPLRPFLFNVHVSGSSCLKVHVSDFYSNTFEAVRSIEQLEDLRDMIGIGGSWCEFMDYLVASIKSDDRDMIGIGGSWCEFMDYLVASIKSDDVKLILDGQPRADGAAYAKLVAQKSKGMPLISISLAKLVDAAASEVMANLSLEDSFGNLGVLLPTIGIVVGFGCGKLLGARSMLSVDESNISRTGVLGRWVRGGGFLKQEKTGTIQKQLDTFLYSKRQKSLKMNDKSNTDALSATGLQDSPDKLAAQNPGSTKVAKRVVPAYRRSKVRGVLLQDTTEDGDN